MQQLTWAGTHARGIWYDDSGVNGGEWDEGGALVAHLHAPTPRTAGSLGGLGSSGTFGILDEIDLYTGSALVAISPVQTATVVGHSELTLTPLEPAGPARVIYSCDACRYTVSAHVVGSHILVMVDGDAAPLLFVVTAQGAIERSLTTAFSTGAATLSARGEALTVVDSQGFWLVNEAGGTVTGPLPLRGDVIDWDVPHGLASVAITRSPLGELSAEDTYLARTSLSGGGAVLHLSSGQALATTLGTHLSAALFVDDMVYFAAMGADGRKLGGDVALSAPATSSGLTASSALLSARGIVREAATADFLTIVSRFNGTVQQHVVCSVDAH